MKKSTKVWLIIAACLVVIGSIIFVFAMSSARWNLSSFADAGYVTDTIEISEPFDNISISAHTEDISVIPSDNEKCSVVFREPQNCTYSAAVADGTLTIEASNYYLSKQWYENIVDLSVGAPMITVYLPGSSYDSIDITGSTGTITTSNLSAENLDVSVSTGTVGVNSSVFTGDICIDVTTGTVVVNDVACNNISSQGSTGDIAINNTSAKDELSIERSTGMVNLIQCDSGRLSVSTSTGDVNLDQCDSGELEISTTTGNVTGTLLSDKVFITKTNTGDIEVPETTTGGKCKITTSTGDIIINIK